MKRNVWITMTVSETEKARVVAAAAKARRTVSAWARLILLDAAGKQEKSNG